MNDKLNMEEQIREKLDGFSVAPPSHVWDNIRGQMAAQQKKKRVAYFVWMSAAAVVVFAFLSGWYLSQQSGKTRPALAELEIVEGNNMNSDFPHRDAFVGAEKEDATLDEKETLKGDIDLSGRSLNGQADRNSPALAELDIVEENNTNSEFQHQYAFGGAEKNDATLDEKETLKGDVDLSGRSLNGQADRNSPALAELDIVKDNSTNAELRHHDAMTTVEKERANVLLAGAGTAAEIVKANADDKTSGDDRFEDENTAPKNLFVASVEHLNHDLLARLEAIFTLAESDVNLAKNKDAQDIETDITPNDRLLMTANAKALGKQASKENGWIVGAHVSPGYSSQSVNHGKQYSKSMTYSGDNGNGNVGGGFSVQYKTSKRFRLESGVYYSQNGQSSNNSMRGLFDFSSSADYLFASPENTGGIESGFANVVELSSEGIAMNSTAGVIVMQSTPKGATVATNAEMLNAKANNTLTTNGEFSQVFEFVEIPLYLRYSLLDKIVRIEVLAGLNAGVVVGNSAYINNDYGKQNIGSTEDISTLNLSGTIGVGVNYMLNQHFSLAVEPRFNYYLNSINSNPDVDYRPYRIGVFTGIYYAF